MTSEKAKAFAIGGINQARVVDREGNSIPLPSPRTVQLSTSRSKGADKTFRRGDLDFSMTLQAPITAETEAFFDALFVTVKPPESAYKLDSSTGRVYIDGRRVKFNGVSMDARWYFIDQIDRAIWKWALKTGLQLEDAVRELNRLAKGRA